MKNLSKIMLLPLLAMVVACSKSDDDPTPSNGEKVVTVEITNSANFVDYEETLNFQVISTNEDIELNGITWDEVQRPDKLAVWFLKNGDIPSASRTVKSSKPLSAITIAGVINPKELNQESGEDLTTTIKVSIDGKVVKTETVTSTSQDFSNFSIPVSVAD